MKTQRQRVFEMMLEHGIPPELADKLLLSEEEIAARRPPPLRVAKVQHYIQQIRAGED